MEELKCAWLWRVVVFFTQKKIKKSWSLLSTRAKGPVSLEEEEGGEGRCKVTFLIFLSFQGERRKGEGQGEKGGGTDKDKGEKALTKYWGNVVPSSFFPMVDPDFAQGENKK